jgi:hypothetical protein
MNLELGVWIGPAMRSALRFPWRGGQPHRRLLPAERLVRARHSGLGISAARAVPRQKLLTTISPWVVTPEALAPFRTLASGAAAGDPASAAYLLDATDQATGALDIDLEVLLLTDGLRVQAASGARLSAATHAISIGPSPSWSRITPAAAAICGRATSLGPARSRRRKTTASVACWRFPRGAGSRLRWRRAKVAVSWRTATP